MRRWLRAALAIVALALAPPATGQQPTGFQLKEKVEDRLRVFLAKKHCDGVFDARYSAAKLPLGPGDRSLILVYIISAGWCGSGGCDLSLYDDTGNTFRVVADIVGVSKPPVGMLATRTNGWRDLVVGVHEGADGVFPGRVRYARGEYAIDWEEYEAAKRNGAPKGTTVIFTTYGEKPLCQGRTS